MSDVFSIIEPAEATNLVGNPSGEVDTTGWTGVGTTNVTRIATHSYYGIACIQITTGGTSTDNGNYTYTTSTGGTYTFSCVYRGKTILDDGKSMDVRLRINYDDASNDVSTTRVTLSTTWTNLSITLAADGGKNVEAIQLTYRDLTAGAARTILTDGVQLENTTYKTTYLDGDQPGCVWNGERHNSTSTRSALSQDGGREYDFETDLSLYVGYVAGLGAPPIKVTKLPYAMTAGDLYNGRKVGSRTFTFSGHLTATSFLTLQDNMKTVQDVFNVTGEDMVRIHYTGGTSEKWLMAKYEAGLEGNYGASLIQTKLAIRMYSPDPNLYQVNDTNDVLDVNDTATLRYITRRKRSTGQWDDMGLTADPGVNGTVYAILAASDGYIYIGGDFEEWDGDVDIDYVVKYNPYTDTFSTWGAANDGTGRVYDIVEGPDGTIYICGAFAGWNGDGNQDFVTSWTGSAWAAVGTPDAGADNTHVRRMAMDSNGYLHVVGFFEEFAGVAAADGYAFWDGTNWATKGLPLVEDPENLAGIAIDIDDNIYVTGDCDNIGGVTYDNIAKWNGSAWEDVGEGLNNEGNYLMTKDDGKTIIVTGQFTDAGGVTNADYIALWSGTQYLALGSPPNNSVYSANTAPNGDVWIVGVFTAVGSYSTVDRIAIWNGATWTIPDFNLPGAPSLFDVTFTNIDPQSNDNFDVYLGFSTTGAGYFAGSTTVNNPGNKDAYPTFVISRSGGTSAKLLSIRNETTGKQLHMQPGFADGDTFTIELTASGSTVTSDFLGARRYAILPNSDTAEFVLIPGDNIITAFVDIAGAVTMTANCLHKAVFTAMDD